MSEAINRITFDGAPFAASSISTENGTLGAACNAPAPVVANGALLISCTLARGHDGSHEVKVSWARSAPEGER